MAVNPIRTRLARIAGTCIRFKTLAMAEWAFRESSCDDVVSVRLFGEDLPLNVARSVTHQMLCLEGERFISERYLIRSLLSKGATVIDVGANIGYLALLFHQEIGKGGRLICVEPDPENLVELRRGLANKNSVSILPNAVGDQELDVRLRAGLNGQISDDGDVVVRQIQLDSLLSENPDFIKIDVEGYEGSVLRGADKLLRSQRPTLFLELHPGLVPDRLEVREIITKLGTIYPYVEFFEYRVPDRFLGKLATRYGLSSPVEKIEDLETLLADVESGRREQPFWCVCRRPA